MVFDIEFHGKFVNKNENDENNIMKYLENILGIRIHHFWQKIYIKSIKMTKQ